MKNLYISYIKVKNHYKQTGYNWMRWNDFIDMYGIRFHTEMFDQT